MAHQLVAKPKTFANDLVGLSCIKSESSESVEVFVPVIGPAIPAIPVKAVMERVEREFYDAAFQEELFALRIPLSVHIPLFGIVKDEGLSLTELATRLNNFIEKSTGKRGTWSQARLSALKAKNPSRRLTVHQFLMICGAVGKKDPVETFKKLTMAVRTPTEKGFCEIVAQAIKLLVATAT